MKKLILTSLASLGLLNFASANEVAQALCPQYLLVADQTACLDQLDGKYFSEAAVAACSQFTRELSKQQACYAGLADQIHSPAAVDVCGLYGNASAAQLNNKIACLGALGNLTFSDTAVETCTQNLLVSTKQKCLARVGQKVCLPDDCIVEE